MTAAEALQHGEEDAWGDRYDEWLAFLQDNTAITQDVMEEIAERLADEPRHRLFLDTDFPQLTLVEGDIQ